MSPFSGFSVKLFANKIILYKNSKYCIFEQFLTGVAGFPYGRKIYDEQVKPLRESETEAITIVFPEHIERVASSFVQGFFSAIIESNGFENFDKFVTIEARTPELAQNIRGNIR